MALLVSSGLGVPLKGSSTLPVLTLDSPALVSTLGSALGSALGSTFGSTLVSAGLGSTLASAGLGSTLTVPALSTTPRRYARHHRGLQGAYRCQQPFSAFLLRYRQTF